MRHKDHAREALDGCGFYADIGIDILVEKALLGIDSYGFLRMHDLLQEKGQEVVRRESPDEPGRRNRLWNRKEVNYVLCQNTGTETIEGIMVDVEYLGVVHVNSKSFSKMNKLRYLKLMGVDLSNGLEYLPNSLRILEWSEFSLKSFPSSFYPEHEHLRELSMCHSDLEYLWREVKPLHNLKRIDLRYSLSLVKTPDFRSIPFLVHLILEGCERLHEWIGFALCVVFAVPEHQLYGSEEDLDNFLCKLSINGEVGTPSVNYALESLLPAMSNHLWLCYLPPHECYFYFWCEDIYSNIEASFGFIGSTMEVIECGFHLVYEEDFEVLVEQT
ncbi:PREDICTED: TMV resistance [Prunus dulcis]|uniref:PREDICTED: TMV resistance n=1 Tax=Prunus dulcis TaxID=3755 RepID=A0A5E4EME2_PRUDU|nr:PREDICTED: TMV resistance [Prunus dulcis]